MGYRAGQVMDTAETSLEIPGNPYSLTELDEAVGRQAFGALGVLEAHEPLEVQEAQAGPGSKQKEPGKEQINEEHLSYLSFGCQGQKVFVVAGSIETVDNRALVVVDMAGSKTESETGNQQAEGLEEDDLDLGMAAGIVDIVGQSFPPASVFQD